MNCLDGKVALLSGAARGIGAETARLMVEAGAKVAIGDVLDERGRETVHAIGGDTVLYLHRDVTQEEAWTAAVAAVVAHFGKLDILVNNAGLFLGKDIEAASLAEWQRLSDVNLTGVFLGTKYALPALRDSGRDSPHGSAIVNLASVAGLVGSQLDPLYSMTKGGVTLFTKSAALEFARKGYRVRVNSIHPGVIQTPPGQPSLPASVPARPSRSPGGLLARTLPHPTRYGAAPGAMAGLGLVKVAAGILGDTAALLGEARQCAISLQRR
jgi:3(or 17)beta-hydroxysteroid dehydrogenase